MKKIISILLIALTLLTTAGCGGGGGEDVILVPDDVLSPVAIYAMAAEIKQNPNDYAGKSVRAEGETLYNDESSTGYYLRISDSSACCFEDIEMTVPEGVKVPADTTFCHLIGKITVFKGTDGRDYPRFEATEFIYEDQLREMYGEE